MRGLIVLGLGLWACDKTDAPATESDADTDADTDSDTDADTDSDTDTDTDTDPVCGEDGLEENDQLVDAVPLTASEAGLGALDDDWYSLEVAPGDFVSVEVAFDSAAADIDLQLFDPGGNLVDFSETTGSVESVGWVNPGPNTTVFARVFLFSGTCALYDLTLDSGAPPPEDCTDAIDNDFDGFVDCLDYECVGTSGCSAGCPDEDGLEDNDTLATALAGVSQESGLMTHAQDEDWYSLEVGPGEIGRVAVQSDAFYDFALVDLFDETGTQIATGSLNGTLDQVVSENTTTVPVTWNARVFTLGACGSYDLDVYAGPLPEETCDNIADDDLDGWPSCSDYDCIGDPLCAGVCPPEDDLEDNDTMETAIPGAQSETGLSVHVQDEDWYAFTLLPSERVDITVTLDPAVVDIDLAVYNSSGVNIGGSAGAGTTETYDLVNSGTLPETYTVNVYPFTDACGAYDLELAITAIPPEVCDDAVDNDTDGAIDCEDYDCIEDVACAGECPPEDLLGGQTSTFFQAVSLPSQAGLSVHDQRHDWWIVTLAEASQTTIAVDFDPAMGNVEFGVFDEDQASIALSGGANGHVEAMVPNPGPAQDVYVEVRPSLPTLCQEYDWSWSAVDLPEEVCDNGMDDDLDGFADCEDYQCAVAEPTCLCPADDALAPNHDQETAADDVLVHTGQVFAQAQDWFHYTLLPGQTVEATAVFANADGDIDLFMWDEGGFVLNAATTSTDDEALAVTNTTTGVFEIWLNVELWDGTCNGYDLEVTIF